MIATNDTAMAAMRNDSRKPSRKSCSGPFMVLKSMEALARAAPLTRRYSWNKVVIWL
ncbi:hypothetical protein [Propionispira raffinosivorans]|uniref:hypothetical protein n=1 Tax=Propionispira raffinosivorans TaxID=86959 RepID=UPI001FE0EFB2|nr:hypothetical protein [Propionispira raffinosivorans]